jgi:hypothetical protein
MAKSLTVNKWGLSSSIEREGIGYKAVTRKFSSLYEEMCEGLVQVYSYIYEEGFLLLRGNT